MSQNDKLGYLIIKVKDCHKRKFEILAHFSLYYGFDIWPLKCIMLNLKLPVDGKISNNEIHFKKTTKTFIFCYHTSMKAILTFINNWKEVFSRWQDELLLFSHLLKFLIHILSLWFSGDVYKKSIFENSKTWLDPTLL